MTSMSTRNSLANKIVNAMPKLSSGERRIAIGLYRLLAEGEPVSPERLAKTLDLSGSRVRETLSKWTGVYYNDSRAVIGFWGLALPEMPHHFQVARRKLYTWCAWDSLFIPGVLGQTARVESVCPVTNGQIRLEVGPDGVRRVDPPTVMVSFLTPDRNFDRDVIANFCHFIHFFRSADVAATWISRHMGTFLLSVDEAFALGRLTSARNFGEALGAQVSPDRREE